MKGFIYEIAERLYGKYGDDTSSLNIILPSHRASLFLNDALTDIAGRPLWQPAYPSLQGYMEQLSSLRTADKVVLITELYKSYSKYHKESFDTFYFWGEMLLADFDAIDKYRVDARMLFSNIFDLKSLESDLSYLTEEQRKVITSFWHNFSVDGSTFSTEQAEFLKLWRTLNDIYTDFRARLTSRGIGYSGMIQRAAADNLIAGKSSLDDSLRYIIAGFNALTACEKILFDHLQSHCGAQFFWDWDHYYVDNHSQEAGLFLRENIARYPQDEKLDYNNRGFTAPKNITVVSSPSDTLQGKYISTFLSQIAVQDQSCAVVLTNENILMPVLSAVPESVENLNVTMGYPLRQTLAYSFAERLLELQARAREKGGEVSFYHNDVSGLLSHPFVKSRCEHDCLRIEKEIIDGRMIYVPVSMFASQPLLKAIFARHQDVQSNASALVDVLSQICTTCSEKIDKESLSILVDETTKMINTLTTCDVELGRSVFVSLLRRHLQSLRLPFIGEPLGGVQVMGILECRNIDFENVVLLSVNDDNFPGAHASTPSFIPHNLRVGYGLPTPMHHEGVYAYYFYRLLQRAKNVHLVYCSRSDERSTGEVSRYVHQLNYESPHKLDFKQISIDIEARTEREIVVEKSGEVAQKLLSMLETEKFALSPTAFHRYIECPLKFYFRSIARIESPDEVVEELDAPTFGTILHSAMQQLYTELIDVADAREGIKRLIDSPKIELAVDKAIRESYLKNSKEAYSGELLLVKDVVVRYINGSILPFDAAQSPFAVRALEDRVWCDFGFESAGKRLSVRFAGTADRIDTTEHGTRVVDYKTGTPKSEFSSLEGLFSQKAKERNGAAMQTLLYAMMLADKSPEKITPALYYVRNIASADYNAMLYDSERKSYVDSYESYRKGFEELLADKLSELFDTRAPFIQCTDTETCAWCDYNGICNRN